ncbi:MAG: alkaline phosphatase [Bacteroidales bacterium]|nr:alkaline phosphatase [Bacteroidales bacterium]
MKQIKNFKIAVLIVITSIVTLISCNKDDDSANIELNSVTNYKTPKYIFYFIGDGMGAPQINVTEAALNEPEFQSTRTKSVGIGSLNLRQLPVTGMQTTHAEDRYITGSAASATALATGYKTSIGTIAMNSSHTKDYKTIAEMAKQKGLKVGIVSSVSIDHATPACFYAHTDSRSKYQDIGQDLINSNFDYFAGGSVRHNKYKNYSITNFINDASSNGYTYINTRSAFDALNKESGKVIATLEKFKTNTSDGCALPYLIDLDALNSPNDKITLSEFTAKGIELLDNDKGFFLMVEGGKIDWACHANDVVSSIYNTIEFDKAIGIAINFYKKHPNETLIVVTGDHECGGLTLGYSSTGYQTAFNLLQYQSMSYVEFENKVRNWAKTKNATFQTALNQAQAAFGLGNASLNSNLGISDYERNLLQNAFNRSMTGESTHEPEEISVIYGSYDPFTITITHILNNKAGIDWASYKHTAVPIPVFAMGQGMYEFSGYYDNTDVAKKIIKIAQLNK